MNRVNFIKTDEIYLILLQSKQAITIMNKKKEIE